ncbi:unnamed protein product [Mytilus edulis]|uniref:Endonuclease/exonuclease/phosphatase domain-containing protein n=1 Tax=Mytilus edulis TaxID=6550 RepID=A0A8S3PRZ3_MYTED|nr:unnamed protein product [Mytilus edulis]
MRLGHLNICGWTQNDKELRTVILKEVNADIFSICETHLKEIDEIEVDGYTWKGFNRQYIHRNAPKASGGVGLLIKNCIFEEYKYETIDIIRDGVMCGKFQSKSTDFNFIVFSCYLPPENSVWGRDSQGYFAHILSDIYEQCDTDAIFLCGDFNSRIGSLKDYSDFDELPSRLSLDKTLNQH